MWPWEDFMRESLTIIAQFIIIFIYLRLYFGKSVDFYELRNNQSKRWVKRKIN